jgi:hypothetical protein
VRSFGFDFVFAVNSFESCFGLVELEGNSFELCYFPTIDGISINDVLGSESISPFETSEGLSLILIDFSRSLVTAFFTALC